MGNLKINWQGADQFDFDDISPIIEVGIPLIKMPAKDYYDNPISNKYNIGISQ